MTAPTGEDPGAEGARQAAADWFSRLRADPSEGDLAAFRAWRDADPLNGATYDRLARQWEQSKFLANSSLGRGRDLGRARAWHRQPAVRTAAVAAILALSVGGTLLLRPAMWAAPVPAVAYATEGDAVRTVTLADGSRVTLDRNSALRVSFSAATRHLDLLRGRARFDVAHYPARPFVVSADGGSVVAHGTIFDVDLQPTYVRVVLLRGSVEVRGDRVSGDESGNGRMLAAGQTVTFAHGKPPSLPTAADPAETKWPGSMLSFDGTPLRDVAAGFNRRNDVKLVLGSDRIGDLRVTGAFAANDPVGFARAAAAMFRLDMRHESNASISLR